MIVQLLTVLKWRVSKYLKLLGSHLSVFSSFFKTNRAFTEDLHVNPTKGVQT